jgi:hypothetical protein
MQTVSGKAAFLQNEYLPAIRSIAVGTTPLFGKMNVQQMIEHMADSIRLAYGRPELTTILTPEEHLEKMRAFLASDKPFRENTPNAMLPDVPAAPRAAHVDASIEELQDAIEELFGVFAAQPDLEVLNPFFGVLDYEMTMHLLHKHALHHLRQFGVTLS